MVETNAMSSESKWEMGTDGGSVQPIDEWVDRS